MNKIKAYGICLYKKQANNIMILLCKSSISNNKWGFLKGVEEKGESKQQTAQREFFEESSIKVAIKDFEEYFEQINDEKDIGIYLSNKKNIDNIDSFFIDNTLKNNYLSWENQKVKFFDINKLPPIKKKQSKLMVEVIDFLRNKN